MLLDFRQREYNVPLEIGFLKLGPALNSFLVIFPRDLKGRCLLQPQAF